MERPGSTKQIALRSGVLAAGALAVVALAGGRPPARHAPAGGSPAARETAALVVSARRAAGLSTQLTGVRRRLARAEAILLFSSRYQIPADLAGAIYDNARDAGIDPAVGFRLVQVESNFRGHATSAAGAIGYTQIQPTTARTLDPTVTERRLRDRETNLRLGFRYLRWLLDVFDHDLRLALLAYNRGPTRVQQILDDGGDPNNGYSAAVLGGYRGPPLAPTPAATD
jgi:soluble lytic murein transglycosylase-like protein